MRMDDVRIAAAILSAFAGGFGGHVRRVRRLGGYVRLVVT
jgi:hypothetical protein